MTWSLIESGHCNAFDNMAIDEAVFAASLQTEASPPVLRLYGWRPEAISIGCFQRIDELHGELRRRGRIDLVRRATGGSAILHCHELTYSLCIHFPSRAGRQATEMVYIAAHKAIIKALAKLGVNARMRGDAATPSDLDSPFCFAKPTRFDIMVGDRKLVGSAQRRKGKAILQHGSIPIADSHGVPHATGLAEATGSDHSFPDVAECLRWGFETQFNTHFETRRLTQPERDLAGALASRKYRSDRWTLRR